MAAPDYASCNGNPQQFKTWLASNMLRPGGVQNTGDGQTVDWLNCSPALSGMGTPLDVTDTKNVRVDSYDLKTVKDGSGSNATALKAYVCNYVAKEKHSVTLSDQANLFVTTTMNGCTLGIGRPAGNGSVLVTHANDGGRTKEQRDQVFDAHGTQDVSLFEPSEYRSFAVGRSMNIFTFGLREGTTWKFYFQLFEKLSGTGQFKFWGVYPILQQQFDPAFAKPAGV